MSATPVSANSPQAPLQWAGGSTTAGADLATAGTPGYFCYEFAGGGAPGSQLTGALIKCEALVSRIARGIPLGASVKLVLYQRRVTGGVLNPAGFRPFESFAPGVFNNANDFFGCPYRAGDGGGGAPGLDFRVIGETVVDLKHAGGAPASQVSVGSANATDISEHDAVHCDGKAVYFPGLAVTDVIQFGAALILSNPCIAGVGVDVTTTLASIKGGIMCADN